MKTAYEILKEFREEVTDIEKIHKIYDSALAHQAKRDTPNNPILSIIWALGYDVEGSKFKDNRRYYDKR